MFFSVLWLALIVAAVVIEAATAQMISIWFVAGGVAALIANLCGAGPVAQFACYVLVSALALALSRPLVRKKLRVQVAPTNADRMIGQTGVVTEAIDNEAARGQVKVLGSVWSAESAQNEQIPAGGAVEVLRIEGVKLIVEPKASAGAPQK